MGNHVNHSLQIHDAYLALTESCQDEDHSSSRRDTVVSSRSSHDKSTRTEHHDKERSRQSRYATVPDASFPRASYAPRREVSSASLSTMSSSVASSHTSSGSSTKPTGEKSCHHLKRPQPTHRHTDTGTSHSSHRYSMPPSATFTSPSISSSRSMHSEPGYKSSRREHHTKE
jgi:hypothetical protein